MLRRPTTPLGGTIVVGVTVVVVTAVLAKVFLFGNKKKKSPVALQDPNTKYKLKLVDKEVSNGIIREGAAIMCVSEVREMIRVV